MIEMIGEYRGHNERTASIDERYRRAQWRFVAILLTFSALSGLMNWGLLQLRDGRADSVIELCHMYCGAGC